MPDFHPKTLGPNDMPVIFSHDENGHVNGKVSVNEYRKQENTHLLEKLYIKLYREAINYISLNELEKAIDILKHLIHETEYTRYEYVERLANIYHNQQRYTDEKLVLLQARKYILHSEFAKGIIPRIDKRLNQLITHHPLVKSLTFN